MTKIGGKAIIIVGARGKGKTTTVKQLIKKVSPGALFIYDVNGEYTEIVNRPLPDFKQFINDATNYKRSVIVFEEATIFLGHNNSSESMREILVRARHTQNTILLVFHSFRAIPRYIYDLCTDLVVLPTNDNSEFVFRRFENKELLEVFNKVQAGSKYPIAIKLQ